MRRPDVPSASIGGFGRLWLVILTAVAVLLGTGSSGADPAADALARMNELSREAERLTEQLYTAEIDLEAKTVAQQAAEERHRADLVASETAGAELAAFQSAVDDAAAASYMAGSTGSLSAVLIAASPQRLIDDLALKAVLADQMDEQMTAHRAAMTRWAGATRASQASADQARSAAAQAAALRADLQAKQSRLRRQIDAVETQYRDLTPQQQAVLADPGPVPPPPPQDPAVLAMPDVVVPPAGPAGGATVVQAAMSRIGSPYSWGASGPGAFDCSGLIKWAFLQEGKSLPRSSQALAAGGQPIAIDSLQPGDIVTFYADASHAGIYIGDGNMVHASTYGTPVKVAPISSAPIYNARRY